MEKKINWIPALVLSSVALALSVLSTLCDLAGEIEAAEGWGMLAFPVVIVAVVFEYMLLYKIWKALPEFCRETTPGKAVGFMFIPFYNFYWAFVNYVSLVKGYHQFGQKTGNSKIKDLSGLGITYAILFCSSLTTGVMSGFLEEGGEPFQLLSMASDIASFVIFILLFKQLTEYGNMIINSSSGMIPVQPPQPVATPVQPSTDASGASNQTPAFNKDGNTPPPFQEEKISLDCEL